MDKPRLRRRNPQAGEPAEVEIPAYEAMRGNSRLAERMLEILISGVSTRRYEPILPEMAGTVGVSKSQVSRVTIEAGERLLDDLAGRDFSGLDLLAVWIDGIQLGPYHVICAAGVDDKGQKHVLGLREGATENAEVAKALLEDLAGRGVVSSQRRLFVIDGALALRKAVDLVFGKGTPVQRCRNHKLRNVLGHLPKAQHDQARSTLKAAFKLDAKEGTAQLQKYATWLERDWPSAAGSLREGLEELFTINRLGLPSELRRCLGTTNLIDNGHSALRDRVRRVKHWQTGLMALRWAAVAFDAISKGFRRIMGYKHLWMLKAALNESSRDQSLVEARSGNRGHRGPGRRRRSRGSRRPGRPTARSSAADFHEPPRRTYSLPLVRSARVLLGAGLVIGRVVDDPGTTRPRCRACRRGPTHWASSGRRDASSWPALSANQAKSPSCRGSLPNE